MTGKPDEDGLEDIRRLLRRLDEASASGASTPPAPEIAKPIAITTGAAVDRISRELISPPSSDAQAPVRQAPPPPPVKLTTPPARPSHWLKALALTSGAAMAACLTLWWSGYGLMLVQPFPLQALYGSGRVSEPAQVRPTEAIPVSGSPATSVNGTSQSETARISEPARRPRIAQNAQSSGVQADAPSARPSKGDVRLRVAARVAVLAGQKAQLPIEIDQSVSAGAPDVVVVKGLPDGVTLNKGAAVAGGQWSIGISEVGNLSVAVPASASGRHVMTIELRTFDSVVLASVTSTLEIVQRPASAPMSDQARASEAAMDEWLVEAKKLIGNGHIARSRLLLERAADNGLAEAARVLGDTYDPVKLFTLGVRGMSGDIDKAIYWYERADELGDPQAKARLLALGAR